MDDKGDADWPRAVAIIPARGGSKRLPRKNIVPILGQPLIGWSIQAALASRAVGMGNVFVSTEDDEIADVARDFGANIVGRPPELAQDNVTTEPVIRAAIETLEAQGRQIELVVWMNACAPEVRADDIDFAVQRLLTENLREVFSVDGNLRSTSVVRALRREALFQRQLSYQCGVMVLRYVDIHYAADIAEAENQLRLRVAGAGGR